MHNEFTAIFERDGDWHVAYCPEIPGANGQGRTKEEARKSLADAIALILEDRRDDAMRGAACRPTPSGKRWWWSEPEQPAPALASAWLLSQARRGEPLVVGQPGDGSRRVGAAPPRDPERPREKDLSQLVRARGRCDMKKC